MKNIVKKIGALVLVWVVCLATLSPAYAAKADLPELPKDQCVVDEANVLSSSTVQTITDLNAQLQSSCKGATIGVLTVDYTGSCTTEEYALQAANAWGIGSSTGNNGVLILLVMETQQYADGDYYIATGDGFRNTTLESQASALAQTMEDDFVRQDYDDAVTTCARNVAQTIADIYGVSLSGGNTNNGSYDEPAYDDNSSSGGFGDILLGFVTILFTIILLLIIVSVIVYTFSGPLSGLFWCFVFINHLRPSLIGLRTVMQRKSYSNSCQKHYHSSCSKSRLSPSFRCFYLLFFLLDCCTVRTKRSVVRKRLSAFYTFFTHIFLLLRYIYG